MRIRGVVEDEKERQGRVEVGDIIVEKEKNTPPGIIICVVCLVIISYHCLSSRRLETVVVCIIIYNIIYEFFYTRFCRCFEN